MIKNLIFDVGFVLLGYRWQDMMRDHGYEEDRLKIVGETVFGDEEWKNFDGGKYTMDELIALYGEKYPHLAEDIAFFLQHSVEMKTERPEVYAEIARLKEKGFRIYILSNYSEDMFRIHMEGNPVLELLDGGVVSYERGLLKPQPEIYQYLFSKYGLCAEECLFFDDLKDNIEGAKNQGMYGIQVISEQQLVEELKKL